MKKSLVTPRVKDVAVVILCVLAFFLAVFAIGRRIQRSRHRVAAAPHPTARLAEWNGPITILDVPLKAGRVPAGFVIRGASDRTIGILHQCLGDLLENGGETGTILNSDRLVITEQHLASGVPYAKCSFGAKEGEYHRTLWMAHTLHRLPSTG